MVYKEDGMDGRDDGGGGQWETSCDMVNPQIQTRAQYIRDHSDATVCNCLSFCFAGGLIAISYYRLYIYYHLQVVGGGEEVDGVHTHL